MARTWVTIEVQLVSGRGTDFWPRPGRVLLARRSTSLRALARAIDAAFGRWELSHLHSFVLTDGREVVPLEGWEDGTGEELDDERTTLAQLAAGEQFAYEFDLGDSWEHVCTLGPDQVDPEQVYGDTPESVVVIDSWGGAPDQHGRRWRDDDGESDPPPRPDPIQADLPPLLPHWGREAAAASGPLGQAPTEDTSDESGGHALTGKVGDWDRNAIRDLRGAVARRDVATILDVLRIRDPLPVGQLAGEGLLIALEAGASEAVPYAHSLARALRRRHDPGDEALADDLLQTSFRGGADRLPPLAIDLDDLAMQLHSDDAMGAWRIDLQSGRMWPDEPEEIMGEEPPDHWDDDQQWLEIDSLGSKAGWQDMADFAETVGDPRAAAQLRDAIAGRGAFRRFRDAVHRDDDLATRWQAFSDDRERGRARAWLAERGYRAGGLPR